jgi:hypothetical protein
MAVEQRVRQHGDALRPPRTPIEDAAASWGHYEKTKLRGGAREMLDKRGRMHADAAAMAAQ